MLILTRRVGESLMIGDDVTITVLGVGNQVRIGVKAPKEVVHREEILNRIEEASAGLSRRAAQIQIKGHLQYPL